MRPLFIAALFLATGCTQSDDDDTSDGTDTDTAVTVSDDEFCQDQPVVTYDNHGKGFMIENCQACHASTAPNRYGAPDAVTFDNEAECWDWRDRILIRTIDIEDMPPQGGVEADDRLLTEIWLRCDSPD